MNKLEYLGRQADLGRDLALWALPRPLPRAEFAAGLPPGHFACLLVWDSEGETVESIAAVTGTLVRAGCVCANTWGTGCSRVHDIFDEELVMMRINGEMPDDDAHMVMTTWHAKESLEDALFFLLCCTSPFEAYEATCQTFVVVTIGATSSQESLIQGALRDPEAFLRDHCEDERVFGSDGA